ncbi:hypothetical protein V9T40_008056 [Parthenolecanium corni]|uniref:Carboxylesterase type B domain-containing protein n=1 Tax=Parthenolecanium corni TaxID=536013 RepID=A0AAN9TPF5_9HEMI
MSHVYRILVFYLLGLSVQIVNCIVIQTKYGAVNGTTGKSRDGREFLAFYGIPFAEPPVGNLRFKPPVELKSWTGIREVQKWPPACIQSRPFGGNSTTVVGQEDCLYLNVFTPVLKVSPETPKLSVMIYIHGGAFMGGHSSMFGPEYFMDKDIVLVTIQYRLGSFGFLGLGVNDLLGNFGLKDQTMALRWVNKNIGAFGGNAHNVTLFGGSSGSASVHLLMFMPPNKGLFHKAIMQSGNAFSAWAVNSRKNGRLLTTAFAVATSCYRRKIKSMVICLQELPAIELVNAENRLTMWENEPMPFFKPMVEGDDEMLLSVSLPYLPHGSNYQVKIPWMIGMNSAEGAFRAAPLLTNDGKSGKELNENYLRYVPIITHTMYNSDPEKLAEISERIKVYYFGTADIGPQTDSQLVNMFTDASFTYPLIKSVLSHKNKTTYVYLYDHNNQAKMYKNQYGIYEKDLGVYHGQELIELFAGFGNSGKLSSDDLKISKHLIDYWTNFAIYGNPNGKDFASREIWIPTKIGSEVDYLWIRSGGSSMAKGLLLDRYKFWDSLPLGLNWLELDSSKQLSKRQLTDQTTTEPFQSKEFFDYQAYQANLNTMVNTVLVHCCLLTLLIFCICNAHIVKVENGFLRGDENVSKNGRVYYEFCGIPYAAPPVGNLRFKAPVSPSPWKGVRTSRRPPSCIQPKGTNQTKGQEDCLYLNVYTPYHFKAIFRRLPVMVFFHGGAYKFGDGISNDPKYFMGSHSPVIFVTLNHRLGVFGYLSMSNHAIPGNYGLKDQLMALKWINRNIKVFGGNPKSVTLMGQSTGALCVELHLLSEKSRGLFHNAIGQSGSILTTYGFYYPSAAKAVGTDLLLRTGCLQSDTNKTLACLQKLEADLLIQISNQMEPQKWKLELIFRPTIEYYGDHKDRFLSVDPRKSQYSSKVPYLHGHTVSDGLLFADGKLWVRGVLVKLGTRSVNGTSKTAADGKIFNAFYGIPYAMAPVGSLRFKAPVEAPPWVGTLDATKIPNICVQLPEDYVTTVGDEDCLTLNIYTPKNAKEGDNIPVIFYIFGGVFKYGSSLRNGPQHFMTRDIIIVMPNFRVGALGFLSTGDDVISGNMGLKDQSMALKWVKHNIHFFGGDSNRITIHGHSSGAISAHLQTLSPMSKGLYNRVILQSGTGFCTESFFDKDVTRSIAKEVAQRVGCNSTTSQEMLDCFLNLQPDVFAIVQEDLFVWNSYPDAVFRPTIENVNAESPFLTTPPVYTEYESTDQEWMIGITSGEAVYSTAS